MRKNRNIKPFCVNFPLNIYNRLHEKAHSIGISSTHLIIIAVECFLEMLDKKF